MGRARNFENANRRAAVTRHIRAAGNAAYTDGYLDGLGKGYRLGYNDGHKDGTEGKANKYTLPRMNRKG